MTEKIYFLTSELGIVRKMFILSLVTNKIEVLQPRHAAP